MEVTGLAISVVSLSSLFVTFFDSVKTVYELKHARGDIADTRAAVEFEAERIKYVQKKYDLSRLDPASEPLLQITLISINKAMKEIEEVILKYHSVKDRGSSSSADPAASGAKVLGRLTLRNSMEPVKWITRDKLTVAERLGDLRRYTATLWSFATTEAEKIREDYLLRAGAVSTDDGSALSFLANDLVGHSDISKAAKIKHLLSLSVKAQTAPSPSSGPSDYRPRGYLPIQSIQWQANGGLSQATGKQWSTGTCTLSKAPSRAPVLVEWRGAFMGGDVARPAIETRLDRLHDLLCAMYAAEKEEAGGATQLDRQVEFGMLKCLGWTHVPNSFQKIGLVFQFPHRDAQAPRSLKDTIASMRKTRKILPLGHRFDLAFGICSAVANIIAVGWMHRAVRSENMLVFGNRTSRVFFVGFTYARQGDKSQEFSELPKGHDWDYYRFHASFRNGDDEFDVDPPLEAAPETTPAPGSAAHDLYGLGIVLLEIGLWTTVQSMAGDRGVVDFQANKLRTYVEQLSHRCGDIYQSVVEKCLTPSLWEPSSLTDKLADILADLKRCHA